MNKIIIFITFVFIQLHCHAMLPPPAYDVLVYSENTHHIAKALNTSSSEQGTPIQIFTLNEKTKNYDLKSELNLVSDFYTENELLLSNDGRFLIALEDKDSLPIDLDEERYSIPVENKTNVVISIYDTKTETAIKQFLFSDIFTQDDLDAMSVGPLWQYLIYWRGDDGFCFQGSNTNSIFVSGPKVNPRHPGFEIILSDLSISRLAPHWAEETPVKKERFITTYIYGGISGFMLCWIVELIKKRKCSNHRVHSIAGSARSE